MIILYKTLSLTLERSTTLTLDRIDICLKKIATLIISHLMRILLWKIISKSWNMKASLKIMVMPANTENNLLTAAKDNFRINMRINIDKDRDL